MIARNSCVNGSTLDDTGRRHEQPPAAALLHLVQAVAGDAIRDLGVKSLVVETISSRSGPSRRASLVNTVAFIRRPFPGTCT